MWCKSKYYNSKYQDKVLDLHGFDASYLFVEHALKTINARLRIPSLVYQEPDSSVPSTCFSVNTSAEDEEVMQQEDMQQQGQTSNEDDLFELAQSATQMFLSFCASKACGTWTVPAWCGRPDCSEAWMRVF